MLAGILLFSAGAVVGPKGLAPPRVVRALGPGAFPVVVQLGSWPGSHVNLSVACPACGTERAAGSVINVSLGAVPECGAFGCSGDLLDVRAAAPFTVVSVVPSLPATLDPLGAQFAVAIRLPDVPGSYVLNGSATASVPPGPVRIAAQSWTVENETNASGGVNLTAVPSATEVAGGAFVNDTLELNNSNTFQCLVLSVQVAPPFQLVQLLPGLPYDLIAGHTSDLVLQLRGPPAPGNYTISGVVSFHRLPEDFLSPVTVNFTGVANSLLFASSDLPTSIVPGEEGNGSLLLYNPANVSHTLQFNRTYGLWIFVNITPSGPVTMGAGAYLRFFLTISASQPPGTYGLDIAFRVIS